MLSSRSISFLFSLLILSALNDLPGPSAGPLAQTTYSIPCAYYIILSCGLLLFCFILACFLSSCDHYFSGCRLSRSLAVVIFLAPLFSLVAPAFILAASIVCLSLAVLLYLASPSQCLLSYVVRYPMTLLRFPVPSSSRLLPSPLLQVRVLLLPSYFSFSFYLPFLRGLFIIGALAPSGLPSASTLAFSLYVSFCIAGASLFYAYPGILARVFSAIIRFRLPLSRRFTSTLSVVRFQAHYLAFCILLHLFGCSIAFA